MSKVQKRKHIVTEITAQKSEGPVVFLHLDPVRIASPYTYAYLNP